MRGGPWLGYVGLAGFAGLPRAVLPQLSALPCVTRTQWQPDGHCIVALDTDDLGEVKVAQVQVQVHASCAVVWSCSMEQL